MHHDPLALLIVADDPLARAGLAALLADAAGCEVVAQAGSEAAADFNADLADVTADVATADVVIWDVGWETAVPPEWPDVDLPLVLLSDEPPVGQPPPRYALLPRAADADQIVAAATAVYQGLIVLAPTLVPALLPAATAEELAEPLTPREAEVLQLLAEGLTNRAIALRLDISEHTVKFHINALLGKLGAASRTEAVVRATRLGLIVL